MQLNVRNYSPDSQGVAKKYTTKICFSFSAIAWNLKGNFTYVFIYSHPVRTEH